MDKSLDEKIEREIEGYFREELSGTAADIKIQCRDGYVTLAGFVDVLAEKYAAGELAKRIEGVKSVENCLTVSMDGVVHDKDVEGNILNKLRKYPDLISVTPKVNKGNAVLEGSVETLKNKNLANHLTARSFGVKDIVSNVKIHTVGKIDDVTIHNTIEQRLVNKDLDDDHIKVEVEEGGVKLSGFVSTFHDMEAAVEVAEGVEGVKHIRNMLRLRKEGH